MESESKLLSNGDIEASIDSRDVLDVPVYKGQDEHQSGIIATHSRDYVKPNGFNEIQ